MTITLAPLAPNDQRSSGAGLVAILAEPGETLEVNAVHWGVEIIFLKFKDIQLLDSKKRVVVHQAEAERAAVVTSQSTGSKSRPVPA